MTDTNPRPLKVFLSHAHADADAVRALYDRLVADGVDAWLDKEKLIPGQDWEREIRKAVREADVVIVCLSKQFNQRGYRQKEVRIALDEAEMMPEGEIFIIPARLEECDVPEILQKWQRVDLFETSGHHKLMSALHLKAENINAEGVRETENEKSALLSQSFEKIFPESLTGNIINTGRDVSNSVILIGDNNVINQPASNQENVAQKVKKKKKEPPSTIVDGLDWEYAKKAAILNARLGDAFPGLRDVARYKGEDAVDRLMVLLREPLSISHIKPFYWVRGDFNGHVSKFEKIDSKRVLLNDVDVLNIDYIVAVRKFSAQYKNFIYIQTMPEEPTGLYNDNENLENLKSLFGFSYEKYGVWKDKVIPYAEYEDGSTIIDGKPVSLHGVQLRKRYTSSYNFILCNQDHTFNKAILDTNLSILLNGILNGELSVVSFLDSFEEVLSNQ